MSSTEDDEYLIKLDSNIEIESIVRNRFEEGYHSTNSHSESSDEDRPEISGESSCAEISTKAKESKIAASAVSEVSDNIVSAISDISADSSDSMTIDASSKNGQSKDISSKLKATVCVENQLKNVNCKELIVFCVDMSSDMEKIPFLVTDEKCLWNKDKIMQVKIGDQRFDCKDGKNPSVSHEGSTSKNDNNKRSELSPLNVVKRAIGIFVHNKNIIDKRHEYALMVLYETATWVCEFTNNPKKLVQALEDVTETLECNTCDLSSILSLLTEKYPFIISTDFLSVDAHRILRVILLYGRSNCLVEFSNPSDKDILLNYPSFYFDILYVHEPLSDENKCLEIYKAFCDLDDKDKSYIFEMTRSVTKLHNCMGKLLSHPFQRAPQKNANYRLQDIIPIQN